MLDHRRWRAVRRCWLCKKKKNGGYGEVELIR